MPHPHPSEALGLSDLHRDHHDAFAGATATFPAPFDTANQGLVNLNVT
jgi:hypothetical protein